MQDVGALILAAGWGTRMLPATKVIPKEMMPVVDKPIIHYTVGEAVASGLEHVVIVTARGKDSIEDYFDRLPELELLLAGRGDNERLAAVTDMTRGCHLSFVRQQEQLGIGHAVMEARHAVGDRPFVLYFPDDVIVGDRPVTAQLLDVYRQYNGSVLAVEQVPRENTSRYGIVDVEPVTVSEGDSPWRDRLFRVKGLVEKPKPEDAPSTWGIVGRYVLTPGIFGCIESTTPGAGGEIQITDAIQRLLDREPVYAYAFEGDRFDTGNPVGLLRASVAVALRRPDLAAQVREMLAEVLASGR